MVRTRILLGSALALSLLALASTALRPRPVVPPAGLVAASGDGGPLKVELRPSHTAVHTAGTELFTELTVTLDVEAPPAGLPLSLALVLDTSGSMTGQKLDDARRAAHRLVDLLAETDELALVTFGTEVTVTARQRLDAPARARFHEAIDGLAAVGGTSLSGGLEAGWSALRGSPGARRLVLVSDGKPTQGLVAPDELGRLAGRVHDDAITVTALGVGADIDGALMQLVAERGGGMYGYLQDAGALEEILGREVEAGRRALARNVVLELEAEAFIAVEVPGRAPVRRDGRWVLSLADLRPKTPTRVLARLRSRALEEGVVAPLRATVRWRPVGGEPQATAVALALPVLDDAEAVRATRDEGVYARGVSAAGSLQLVAAAAAYERGDEAAARSLLDGARSLFAMSADALAGEAEVEQVRQSFRAADPTSRKGLARQLEKKKLSSFGKENEGY